MHGVYGQAPKDVAKELNVLLIDWNKKSKDFFTTKGEPFVSENYFMNLLEEKYKATQKDQRQYAFATKGSYRGC